MAEMQNMHRDDAYERPGPLTHAVNLLGAVMSLALLVGAGMWGYKLVVRDVSGVPVIRAAEGPMRVQPDDPGGRQAAYQGLSVNDVAAGGTASAPADRLILAPEPLDLTLEDVKLAATEAATVEGETRDTESGDAVPAAPEKLSMASIEAFAEELAQDSAPLQDADPAAEPAEETSKPRSGLGRSLRPRLRPSGLATGADVVTRASAQVSGVRDIDPTTIAAGTRLAQLGAFSSREIAVKEWTNLSDRFEEYLQDKDRVIQKATSGGRTFYRLRAMGFDDLSDARRFCSALVAERAECIPVVVR